MDQSTQTPDARPTDRFGATGFMGIACIALAATLAACSGDASPKFAQIIVPGGEPPPCDEEPDAPVCVATCEEMDTDADGVKDIRDPDLDGDGVPNEFDNCLYVPNAQDAQGAEDFDADGFGDACDNCPDLANPDQADWNFDGVGDACGDDEAPGLYVAGLMRAVWLPANWLIVAGVPLGWMRWMRRRARRTREF